MVKHLLPLITVHDTYVEHFAGGAALFFSKPPSSLEVLNDIDGDLINFFRVLQDVKTFNKFHRVMSSTPFSRQVYREARATLGDEVERACKFYVVALQSFSGTRGSWGGATQGSGNIKRWLSRLPALPEFHSRLMGAQIECLDFRGRYDDPQTFHYIDPPYLGFSSGFRFKMAQADHEDLLSLAVQLCGKVVVNGYRSRLYDERLAGWHRLDFEIRSKLVRCTPSAGTEDMVVESVWLNKRARNI